MLKKKPQFNQFWSVIEVVTLESVEKSKGSEYLFMITVESSAVWH